VGRQCLEESCVSTECEVRILDLPKPSQDLKSIPLSLQESDGAEHSVPRKAGAEVVGAGNSAAPVGREDTGTICLVWKAKLYPPRSAGTVLWGICWCTGSGDPDTAKFVILQGGGSQPGKRREGWRGGGHKKLTLF